MPESPPPIHNPGLPPRRSDLDQAAALNKSYLAPAAVVFFLYTLGYIPGLVFNLLFLSEARQTKRMTGRTPSGYEVLWGLLILGLLWFFSAFAIVMLVFGIGTTAFLGLLGLSLAAPAATNATVRGSQSPQVIVLKAKPSPAPAPAATPVPIPTERPTVTPPQPAYRGKSYLTGSTISVSNFGPDISPRESIKLDAPVGLYVIRETYGGPRRSLHLECLVSRWEGDSWIGWVTPSELAVSGAVEMSREDMTKQLPLLKAE
jgi:hypothetical protein